MGALFSSFVKCDRHHHEGAIIHVQPIEALLAPDGRQGYQIAVRDKPSVIISDYFMPTADINFLMWRLRSTPSTERIPVFAMTGQNLDRIDAESLTRGPFGRRGVDRIFKKPLNIEELFVSIQKYCALATNKLR
jgi:CheY-like chemotaxis protein